MSMEIFEMTGLLEGRPENIQNEKEQACYDILDKLGISYQRVEYNFFPSETQQLRQIDDVLGVAGIKNLIFRTRNKSQFFFVILPREGRFDEKGFRAKYQLPKITMAKGDELSQLLNTHAGAVSIMELIHDKEGVIHLFAEEGVLQQEYFRFHPNENRSTVRIRMEDFKHKLLPYLNHDLTVL